MVQLSEGLISTYVKYFYQRDIDFWEANFLRIWRWQYYIRLGNPKCLTHSIAIDREGGLGWGIKLLLVTFTVPKPCTVKPALKGSSREAGNMALTSRCSSYRG